jgi:hypothetical protein
MDKPSLIQYTHSGQPREIRARISHLRRIEGTEFLYLHEGLRIPVQDIRQFNGISFSE